MTALKSLLVAASLWASLAQAQTQLPQTLAEVRKIDLVQQKITLKHGEIKNLDMPPMTMVFKVQDPALLKPVKVGDQVLFTVDVIQGSYTVLTLQPAK